ncbi:hypothetical protein D3C75_1221550 [compost metagenome]
MYSPLSRSWLMVWRISAGERRMLASVSMSDRVGGTKVAFSWVREVVASPWDSFLDCTITCAVISKLCLSTIGSSRAITAKIRKTRLTNCLLAKKILKNSCR